jgi:hypothetical protein
MATKGEPLGSLAMIVTVSVGESSSVRVRLTVASIAAADSFR